jgi:hypothetical protein
MQPSQAPRRDPPPAEAPAPDFLSRFRGPFRGILTWAQLDTLWDTVRGMADAGWYIYAVGQPPPEKPATADELAVFLREIDDLLRREHDEEYCGIVYADDPAAPTFIKIFDPNNLGVVCGFSDNPPLPGWILSLQRPQPLAPRQPVPAGRTRWWRRVLGLATD